MLIFNMMPIAGVLYSFGQSDAAGRGIVLILLFGSILAWSVMITKIMQLSKAQAESAKFLRKYRSEAEPVAIFLQRTRFEGSPLYRVYEKTCNALGATIESAGANPEDLFMGGVADDTAKLTQFDASGLDTVAERTTADEALSLEHNMGFLATSVASAPLLGLLGTVWGGMNAFGGMALSGSAMLSAVAPGISGALLTTVVGLVVAIPSTIGYNLLSAKIRRLCVDMENFAQELMSDIERSYVTQDGGR
jgi:biopolymer transport protein ExbB/TolQ